MAHAKPLGRVITFQQPCAKGGCRERAWATWAAARMAFVETPASGASASRLLSQAQPASTNARVSVQHLGPRRPP